MASPITKLTVLAVLFALPAASAVGVPGSDPPSSQDDPGDSGSNSGDGGGSTDGGSGGGTYGDGGDNGAGGLDGPTPDLSDTWQDVDNTVETTVDKALHAVPCQQAVRVERTWYAAHVTDSREKNDAWREYDWYAITHYRQVPVSGPSSPLVDHLADRAGGLLDGTPLSGASSTVTSSAPVVYRTEAYDVWTKVPVSVRVEWAQNYWHWVQHHDSFLLAMAAGAPFLATGEGQLVEACDAATPLVSHVPDPSANGAVATCWKLCRFRPSDGWHTTSYDVDAWLTRATDMSLPFEGNRWNRCHYWSGCGYITNWVSALSPTLAELLFQQAELDALSAPPVEEQTKDAQVETQGTATGAFPVGALVAGLVGLLAAAGAGTYVYLRRK